MKKGVRKALVWAMRHPKVMLAAGLSIVALVGWLGWQLHQGAQARAEVDRLNAELTTANEALEAERDLLERRTQDLRFQIDMQARQAERRRAAEQAAREFEERIDDFGPPVDVSPLIERTLREIFP